MPHNPQQNSNAMRQDAMRRSRDMQRRDELNAAASADIPPYIEQKSDAETHRTPLSEELSHLLTGWDGERLALLGLLYFLYKEGADIKLLLAIGYILL